MSDEAKKDVDLTALTADLVAKFLAASGRELSTTEFIKLIADTKRSLESGAISTIPLTVELVATFLATSGRKLSPKEYIQLIVDTRMSLESTDGGAGASAPSAVSEKVNRQIHTAVPQHPIAAFADPENEEIVQRSSRSKPAKGFAVGLLREPGKKYHPQRNVFTEGPAVDIEKSVTRDRLVCLEDGANLFFLKRHLRTYFGMSFEEYREKWGLPPDYPQKAEGYSERRRRYALAKMAEAEDQNTQRRASDKNG